MGAYPPLKATSDPYFQQAAQPQARAPAGYEWCLGCGAAVQIGHACYSAVCQKQRAALQQAQAQALPAATCPQCGITHHPGHCASIIPAGTPPLPVGAPLPSGCEVGQAYPAPVDAAYWIARLEGLQDICHDHPDIRDQLPIGLRALWDEIALLNL